MKVTVGDKFRTPEQIGELIIQGHEDDRLRLKDIATVESGYETPQRNSMEYNGERAIGMVIAAGSGTDIVKVGKQVEKRLEELSAERLPVGIECHKVFFQPDEVTSSLTTFVINLIESVLIVIAILMLTMGFRSGLMIGISLVVIVIGSFLLLGFMDGTMQRVSLASFIFAMGMLVDNAIVITDGILVGLKTGKPRREAMTEIGRKAAMLLLGATVIAILSLLPVFLSPDSAGVYVRDLFIVLAVSLLLSWILALVHVPLMADKMLKGAKYEKADTEKSMYDGWLYRFLRKALTYSIKHKFASIVIALALIGSAFWGYKYMRQGFFPDMTYSQLYMEYKLPEGTSPSRVEADLKEIREWLQKRPEIKDVTTSLGGTPARYNLVRSIATPSLSYGELIIDFTDPKTLEKSIDGLQEQLTAKYPDAYVKLKRYNIMYKKYPIELVFTGPDPAVLQHLADSAESIMNSMPEICLITTDREPYVPVLDVAYNQPAARSAGVSRSDVSMSMLMANGGLPVSTYYEGNRRNTIYIKCLDDNGGVMDNLENVPIMQTVPDVGGALTEENMLKMRNGTLAKGDLIESMLGTKPVKQVSDGIDIEWETPVVPRYNGQRSQKVMCSPAPGIETENARKAEAAGMSDRNDVLKVEVKVNEGALNLKRTENAVRLAKMNLCHYNGYPLDSEVDVAESSLPESGSVSGSTAISGRPEYQMLDKKVQAAAQQVRMTRADALPQAGIFAGYGYTHGLTVNDETFIDKAGFSVGAKVGIPIFHFGEHFYKVKSDKSEYEQAVSERDSSYELMTLEMSKAANELDESEYERALAASNTASAEENVRVSRLHYDAGTVTLSDLLEAQTLWQVANRDSVEADINHFLAWLSYLKTTGQICNEFIK